MSLSSVGRGRWCWSRSYVFPAAALIYLCSGCALVNAALSATVPTATARAGVGVGSENSVAGVGVIDAGAGKSTDSLAVYGTASAKLASDYVMLGGGPELE